MDSARPELPFWKVLAGMALIAVLGAMAFLVPLVVGWRRESRNRVCQEHLREIGTGFKVYQSRFGCCPDVGARTWFRLLYETGSVADAGAFRCPRVEGPVPRTDYAGMVSPGTYQAPSGPPYHWRESLPQAVPPDLPMAMDGDVNGEPNHGAGSPRNVLFFEGRVDAFEVGGPTETFCAGILGSMVSGWAAPAGTR